MVSVRRAPVSVPKEAEILTLPRDGAEAAKVFKHFPREQRAAFVNNYWMQLKAFYETGKFPDVEAFETSHKFMIELVKDPAFKRLKPYVELGDISHQMDFTHPSSLYDFVERNKTDYPDIVSDVNSWRSKVRERSVRPDVYDNGDGGVSVSSTGAISDNPIPVGKGTFTGDSNMLPVPYKEPVAEPKEGVVVGPDTPIIPAGEKPTPSPSPEVKTAGVEETPKAEAVTDKVEDKVTPETPETPKEGALTGEGEKTSLEPSKGMFKKMLGWVRNHPKTSWGVGIPTVLGLVGGIGITQADKIAKALKAGEDLDRNADEESELPEVFDNVNYRVWENYTPDYLNEEYVPGKIPSHIPQDNLPSIKESTASKKVKSQPQVADTPVNNATADYVRAAYNSYIPSDAGRAYQKAIYGDPLELERMRLQQQQQQKWRDFVMRSGQSPAELVQRGLMPYDALQYI